MTEVERAQLALELLNAFVPLLVGAFLLGLLVGVFFFSRLADFIDRIADKKKPNQVTFSYQSGTYEQELYRFEDKYYPLEDYETLCNLRKYKIKRV
ncbi:hypothetical protein NDN11_09370 [Acinetobacter sp. C26M]|uniref:hypothetical protein n=1 Tax=unclassified Acinetobacter TaxID=196816 RepID=UPI002037067F|nr:MULTISPECIES: hypothetical protein [unclassified Acinetobacter]USA44945.1 hypothetical protein NDN11_09370 [Acinetobacter sp. C26M]USA48448.1 hypothetical protein NDN12_09370 [Acinetobacter sp. C26G]